jgi:peroxiredoxin
VHCQAYAVQLHRAREQFEAADAGLVLIGQATPRHAAHFRRRQGTDLRVLADEKRTSYRAIGAKVGGVTDLFAPQVVLKGMLASARTGKVQGRTIGNAAQLGAAAVIDTSGRIVWSHISQDAGDNASPEEILEALRGS